MDCFDFRIKRSALLILTVVVFVMLTTHVVIDCGSDVSVADDSIEKYIGNLLTDFLKQEDISFV